MSEPNESEEIEPIDEGTAAKAKEDGGSSNGCNCGTCGCYDDGGGENKRANKIYEVKEIKNA